MQITWHKTGADPGFPIGGGANPHWRGCQPPTQVLFGETYVKMKEFGPVGGHAPETLYVDLPL